VEYGRLWKVVRHLQHLSGLTPDQEAALTAFRLPAAQEIIRHLSQVESATRAEIAAAIGATYPAVVTRLAELERQKLIVANLPPGQRNGRPVRYSVDRARLDLLLAAFGDYLRGH